MDTYLKIFWLVIEIETHLRQGTRHFYANGQRLGHLDEVVSAILNDTLEVKYAN